MHTYLVNNVPVLPKTGFSTTLDHNNVQESFRLHLKENHVSPGTKQETL